VLFGDDETEGRLIFGAEALETDAKHITGP
jgi:hypothetical protein